MAKAKKMEVEVERRNIQRKECERRKSEQPVAAERRKVQRRRQIDPTTCEREYSADEIEFMHAMDAYKHSSGRMFPTCSEILEVIRDLGYVRASGQSSAPPAEQPAAQPSQSTAS